MKGTRGVQPFRSSGPAMLDSYKESSLSGVAAEEGIGLPLRPRGGVGRFDEQLAGNPLVQSGSVKIDGLVYVVRGGVVAIGEPILENFLFGSTQFEAHI